MVWDMVHFDVQLLGGIVLHRGRIAEMATVKAKRWCNFAALLERASLAAAPIL